MQTRYIDKPSALYSLSTARKCNCISFPGVQEKHFPPTQLWFFWMSFASWCERKAPVHCSRHGREICILSLCLELDSGCDDLCEEGQPPQKKGRMLQVDDKMQCRCWLKFSLRWQNWLTLLQSCSWPAVSCWGLPRALEAAICIVDLAWDQILTNPGPLKCFFSASWGVFAGGKLYK